jgi:hypothetical protein
MPLRESPMPPGEEEPLAKADRFMVQFRAGPLAPVEPPPQRQPAPALLSAEEAPPLVHAVKVPIEREPREEAPHETQAPSPVPMKPAARLERDAPAAPPPARTTSIEIGDITVEVLPPPAPVREARPAAPAIRRVRVRAGRAPTIHRFGLGQV